MKNNFIPIYDKVDMKVLIVECNDLNFYSFERLFSHSGVKLFRVHSSNETVRMALKNFDLIFMNILITNSFHAIQKIKSFKPMLPVIGYSGELSDEDKQRCLEAGFNGYLSEPIEKESILTEVFKFQKKKYTKPESVLIPAVSQYLF